MPTALRRTAAAICVAVALLATAAAGCQRLLLPLYIYPGAAWTTVQAAAASHPDVVGTGIAIANANSGPGTTVDSSYAAAINATANAGITVIGYVHVSYGTRPIADVVADVARWRALYPRVGGFFIDEVPTSVTDGGGQAYWAQLKATIQLRPASAYTVLNPGIAPEEAFVRDYGDTTCIHEEAGARAAAWSPPAYAANYPPSKFCVLYHTVSDAAAMQTIVAGAASRRVGFVYVTDDVMPNPWDALATY